MVDLFVHGRAGRSVAFGHARPWLGVIVVARKGHLQRWHRGGSIADL